MLFRSLVCHVDTDATEYRDVLYFIFKAKLKAEFLSGLSIKQLVVTVFSMRVLHHRNTSIHLAVCGMEG